jgi:hypothetical protein
LRKFPPGYIRYSLFIGTSFLSVKHFPLSVIHAIKIYIFYQALIDIKPFLPINKSGTRYLGEKPMGHKKNLLIIIAAVFAGVVVVFSFTSTQGSQRTYEVQPQITMPGYRSDAYRTLDAYERLMERYMDLVEKNHNDIETDFKKTAAQIDSIEARLAELCERTARIEKALGIAQPKEIIPKTLSDREAAHSNQTKREGLN